MVLEIKAKSLQAKGFANELVIHFGYLQMAADLITGLAFVLTSLSTSVRGLLRTDCGRAGPLASPRGSGDEGGGFTRSSIRSNTASSNCSQATWLLVHTPFQVFRLSSETQSIWLPRVKSRMFKFAASLVASYCH